MDNLACTKCMWTGKGGHGEDFVDICPECGAEVEYIDNYEYLPHEQSFNWNRK